MFKKKHGTSFGWCHGIVGLLILCRLFNRTADCQGIARCVDCVRCDGDSFLEITDVVGVVAYAYLSGFAWHDGFLGVLGGCAAAAGAHVADDEGFVAHVGEGEGAVAIGSFLDGSIVVYLFGKDDFGTVFRCGFFVFLFLCVH